MSAIGIVRLPARLAFGEAPGEGESMVGRAVIMGVAGCGKSSVGPPMAKRLGAVFVDGDSLHPAENIAKMKSGAPLDDSDRHPWLVRIGETLGAAEGSVLIGCSALKRRYRDTIRDVAGAPVAFIHLAGPIEVVSARMARRKGHFMPLKLLDSQYATLEPLDDDELGFVIDIDRPLKKVVEAAVRALRSAEEWRVRPERAGGSAGSAV